MALFRYKIDDDLAIDAPVEVDLPSVRQAEAEALELLIELVRSRSGPLLRNGEVGITVCDNQNAVVLRLNLAASR